MPTKLPELLQKEARWKTKVETDLTPFVGPVLMIVREPVVW